MQQPETHGPAIGYSTICTLVGLASLAIACIVFLANRLDAAVVLDPAFCSPSSLHTTVEPPETQLTRDYAAIRLLLKDPRGSLDHVRQIYQGTFHIQPTARALASPLKSINRAQIFKANYQRKIWDGSLEAETQRIDRERGTSFAAAIDTGLQTGNRTAVEAAFRGVFVALLDDFLTSIEQRLDQPTINRTFQHARRYYSEGLEAYLSIKDSSLASRASFALDAMARAIDDLGAGKPSARSWFVRERVSFIAAISGQ
jgi:hypothetical protein